MKEKKIQKMLVGFIMGVMIAVGYQVGMAFTENLMLSVIVALCFGIITRSIGQMFTLPSSRSSE
ncbi:hypothetical protein [Halobacillus sp. A5]|uniref:hypothetical protein n=1 Tax=Halobacillus sp. A5 TaxID=2880263 RepID=UPI0020A671FE|nr:hypothetical protein [Halobacillus sp. A5]MCP3027195.1 hypothetical protein [Halobacillus sp. A5]